MEIKFRGLSELSGKWYEGDFITDVREFNRTCEKAYILPHWDKLNCPIQVLPDSVAQYTGLKDKNGHEIYENDIVNVREGGHPFVNDWKGIVKMIDGCYLIENFEGTNGEFLYDEIREIEIIGNIYENKELLEVKQ